MQGYQHIVIPIDFSDACVPAIAEARRVAAPEATFHLVHVLQELAAMHPGITWGTLDEEKRMASTREAMRQFGSEHGATGAQLHVLVSTANPANEIAAFANRNAFDLCVVASHGRTGLSRLALGSVAERVVRLCTCPVMVVKSTPVGA